MKVIKTIVLLCIINTFSGCWRFSRMGYYSSTNKKSLKFADKIVKCINNKDSNGLYALFSESVRENIEKDSFTKDSERLFEYVGTNIKEFESMGSSMEGSINHGKKVTCYYSKFELISNDNNFIMDYVVTIEDAYEQKNIGIKSLKIIKLEDTEKYFIYLQDLPDGITLPDEAK